jgi:hypothetical protein
MLNRPGLRLVGIDREDPEPEPPATFSFAQYCRQIDRGECERPIDPIRFALAALDGVSRRIDDLARDLGCGRVAPDDTDRPRAA